VVNLRSEILEVYELPRNNTGGPTRSKTTEDHRLDTDQRSLPGDMSVHCSDIVHRDAS